MKRQSSSTFTEEMTFRTGTILDPKSTRINATEDDRDFYDPKTVDTRLPLRIQISKSNIPIPEYVFLYRTYIVSQETTFHKIGSEDSLIKSAHFFCHFYPLLVPKAAGNGDVLLNHADRKC